MVPNIILIGFMGAGKDTVARTIAQRTGLHFISTDEFVQLKENKSIAQIFRIYGESRFRRLEHETLLSVRGLQNIVLATGGGIVADPQHRALLKKMGIVIHLGVNAKTAKKRLLYNPGRPLIRRPPDIQKIYQQRQGFYNFADLYIDTCEKNPEQVASEIIEYVKLLPPLKPITPVLFLVNAPSKPYPVYVGARLFNPSTSILRHLPLKARKGFIITNPIVGALFLENVSRSFCLCGIEVQPFIVPDGEAHKSIDTAMKICDFLMKQNADRSDILVALGGGVIGDLVGFVASVFKRGMPIVQIPTTLLAQIDASIGGKTGINHPLGKNTIGTFYQPEVVICDTSMLQTLKNRDYKNGIAEAIKYGITSSKMLFVQLEKDLRAVIKRNPPVLQSIITRSVKIKKRVVEQDEREEKGIREILNFGHTVGHALETETAYNVYQHGEAVTIGMVHEARLATANGWLKNAELQRIIKLIKSYQMPVSLPQGMKLRRFKKIIMRDKKIRHGKIKVPVPVTIGKAVIKEVICEKYL